MMRTTVLMFSFLLLLGCNQNAESVSSGETLANSPKPVASANDRLTAAPAGGAPFAGGGDGGRPDPQTMLNKAFFMQHFVAALTSLPSNKNPNPKWASPLKDPQAGKVKCGDCHTKADMSGLPVQESSPAIEKMHADKAFMVDLMTKWVAKLNNPDFAAKGKLKQAVTCTTCHATDPREN
ncbi:MAG TPA: hypothetical protein VK210_04830 [Terriglobia bacterium]|nr:hypothetical protein [Terriglobia bacterium]